MCDWPVLVGHLQSFLCSAATRLSVSSPPGLLFLKVGAKLLAQRHLLEAVKLFAELDQGRHEQNFIQVLLELGQHYVEQRQLGYGAGCYQWALLLSIAANLLECESLQKSQNEASGSPTSTTFSNPGPWLPKYSGSGSFH